MIDQVRAAYTALRSGPPGIDPERLTVLAVDGTPGAFVGLDASGREHLLLETGDGALPESGVATMEVGLRTLVIGGREAVFVDIVCLYTAVAEVFEHFVVAIMERLRSADGSVAEVVSSVLDGWRRFLVAAAGPPGRERLASVFGELLVVLDVLRVRPAAGVDFWVGPFGGRHDLRRAGTAVEVKTTRAHSGRVVTIHGEDQLLEPEGGRLYLHLVRLEEVQGDGRTLASLVDELLSAGAPTGRLFDGLAAAGVPPATLSGTSDVFFDVRERLTIPVDDSVPRIIPATFITGARPVGVTDLSYTVDLDHCLDRGLAPAGYGEVIDRLGGG